MQQDTPQLVSWPMQPVVDTADAPPPDAPSADADADPFVYEERAAIQWVESLSDEEASVVVADAIDDWDRIVGVDTDQTLQDDATGVLGEDGGDWDNDTIDPDEVPPCPTCGSLVAWQSLAGTWRCMNCDPPRVAQRLRRQRDVILRREARRRMRSQHAQEEPEVLNGVG